MRMEQGTQSQALDGAFKALEQYTPINDDPKAVPPLTPIEQAVQAAHGNPATRAALEQRLAPYLAATFSHATRAFVCRQLAIIGSAASVPALSALLADEPLSHMARYALERIPGPEADKALRDAVGKANRKSKVGIIYSIGVRRDARSVPLLAKMLNEEPEVAAAAAKALGEIGTPEAAKALEALRGKGAEPLRVAIADASLICAERLMASGERGDAVRLLEGLTAAPQPHVSLAARRALSAAMGR